MTRKELSNYIIAWNVKYPFDKSWRVKNQVPLFSTEHKKMSLIDIWLETEEDRLYKEALDNHIKSKKQKEEESITSLRDKAYIPGYGNWLSSSEDSLSEEEFNDLFDKINI